MADTRALFLALVKRLVRRARQDLLVRRCTTGFFLGLLPGTAAALLAGSVSPPIPALLFAAGTAAAGCAAGLASALIAPIDRRRLLMAADRTLGSRELASTAFELARRADAGVSTGPFTEAVLEDAARLLERTAPRAILGRLRVRLAPFAALAVLVTALALLFPFDIRALFPRHQASEADLAQIGEDLRKQGLRLAEEARAHDLARSLALSQELAQLGADLAARKIQPDEALDRMSELESGLSQEYQLRIQEAQSQQQAGAPGSGGQTRDQAGKAGEGRNGTQGGSSGFSADKGLNELGDAVDRLRQAQRQLDARRGGGERGERGDGAQAQSPSRQRRQGAQPGDPGSQQPPGGQGDEGRSRSARDNGPDSGSGEGTETPGQAGESGGSGVGTLPAPVKRGAPSEIIDNPGGPSLRAQGDAGEGDSTRMLARSLPQWSGSRLPEEAILNRYSRQAESALARDEVPLKLKEYVKEYFTVIGISK